MSNEGVLHIHLDLVGGLAGDMFAAGAIDAGLVDAEDLQEILRKVGLGPVEVLTERVVRGAMEGTRLQFRGWNPEEEADHRHLSTIRRMLANSELPEEVARRARQMFDRLGEAEAAVHGMELEKVHFHEVGAVDSILDFVAAAWIIEELGASWSVGPIPAGRGTIETAHGTIPVPAPATTRVLKGMEVQYRDVNSEMVTPTGATIAATVSKMGGQKRGRVVASGFGCGSREVEGISNVVRFVVLRRQEEVEGDSEELPSDVSLEPVVQLVCEIDDQTPEVTAHVAHQLLKSGALDVVYEAVQMKKGRLGCRLSVLCQPQKERTLVGQILSSTTTLGVRRMPMERWALRRTSQKVSTPFGEVAVKVAWWDGEVLKVSPEYDSCARIAAQAKVAVREVFEAAQASARAELTAM